MTADFAPAAAPAAPAPPPPAPPTRSAHALKWGGALLKSPSTYLKSFWAQRPAAASTPTPMPTTPPPPPPPLPPPLVCLDRWWSLWFFEHAYRVAARLERASAKNDTTVTEVTERAETRSYLFRYDYGAFWMARPMAWSSSLTKVTVPSLALYAASAPALRWLTGWLFSTARLFKLLRKAPRDIVAQKMIILDAYLPAQNCASFITSLGANVPLSTPLWLCPVAPPLKPLLLAPHGHAKGLVINVGVYGRVCDLRAREYSRKIEEEVAKSGGRKMLYSHNFYSEPQFWGKEGPYKATMPDQRAYQKLRNKYGAGGVFVSLYDKVCETSRQDVPEVAPASVFRTVTTRLLRSFASYVL